MMMLKRLLLLLLSLLSLLGLHHSGSLLLCDGGLLLSDQLLLLNTAAAVVIGGCGRHEEVVGQLTLAVGHNEIVDNLLLWLPGLFESVRIEGGVHENVRLVGVLVVMNVLVEVGSRCSAGSGLMAGGLVIVVSVCELLLRIAVGVLDGGGLRWRSRLAVRRRRWHVQHHSIHVMVDDLLVLLIQLVVLLSLLGGGGCCSRSGNLLVLLITVEAGAKLILIVAAAGAGIAVVTV